MKKVFSAIAGVFFLVVSFSANGQTTPATDFFAGKWDVLIEGLPQGDPRMIVSLERKDGKLTGAIMDSTQKEIAKISKVEEKEKSITVYFSASGYDVYLEMNKKDEEHITANLLGMFEAKGVRFKEKEKN